MDAADLTDVDSLETGGSRGPAGWIEWNRRNYLEHGFGLWIVETHSGGAGLPCRPQESVRELI